MTPSTDIPLTEIHIKHWILFEFDSSGSICTIGPHHIFPLTESIHYQSLATKDFSNYCKLISTTKQKEHSQDKFTTLFNNFNLKKMPPIILEFNKTIKKFLVNDGCHRLATALYLGLFTTHLPKKYIHLEQTK